MLYRVEVGESLSSIARDVLGDMERWPEIARLNQLNPPYIIHPGELMLLPDDTGREPMRIEVEKPLPQDQPGKGKGWLWALAAGAGLWFLS